MKVIVVDFETYYDQQFSLSKLTTEEYVRDPRFEVIGVAVKVDDGPTQWFSGPKAATERWLSQFPWDGAVAVAHNAMFDMAILSWVFGIKPKRIADTLSMARALHGTEVGGSLKVLAEHYGLGAKGDEVIHALGKGRLDFTKDEMERYALYCVNDVELTHRLFQKMAIAFPVTELRLIDLTIRMFTEPTLVLDTGMLESHLKGVVETKEALLGKALIDKDNLMSNPKLAETLRHLGVEPPMKISPTTGKETYAFAKNDEAFKALLEHENPIVQFIVAARLGVKSTLEETRTERFLQIASRGTLPVPLRYYAAHTGRWGGDDKVNLQNLPRKSTLKKAIKAPEGHVFIDCDSSQIEARTLAWLAGQNDLVEFFEKNNAEIAAGVPKAEMQYDPYKIMASQIYGVAVNGVTDDMRFVGKTTILGCLAEGTLVLTDRGWVAIEHVTLEDRLWDGEEWVCHQGLVQKGIKETLSLCGLWLTPDHKVLCGTEWKEAQLVVRDKNTLSLALDTGAVSWLLPDTSKVSGVEYHPSSSSAIAANLNTPWTNITLKISKAPDALCAVSAKDTANVIGNIAQFYPTQNTENDCLIVYPQLSHGVIAPTQNDTPTTGVEVSQYVKNGETIELSFSNTSKQYQGGITPNWRWIGLTTVEGMNPAIFGLSPAQITMLTEEKSASSRRNLMTYDIAYAGPRNRYTVATNAGTIIVHNCGYGMGAQKFQAQLKAFGVDMSLDECKRIINVYRETYAMIPELWRSAGEALDAMANNQATSLGRPGVLNVEGYRGIRLPNNLYIKYPNLRWQFADGKQEMVYDTKKGRATIPNRIYGGKCVENVCQALARIIIGEQMLMIARNLRVVLTVHDAVGVLAPVERADVARMFVEDCMRIQPKWATGLPLNCESKIGASYGG